MQQSEEQKKAADKLGCTDCPRCGAQAVTELGAHDVCLLCGLLAVLIKFS